MRTSICAVLLTLVAWSQGALAQRPGLVSVANPEPADARVPMATLGLPDAQATPRFLPGVVPTSFESGVSSPGSNGAASSPVGTFTGTHTTLPRPVSDSIGIDASAAIPPAGAPCESSPTRSPRLFENLSFFVAMQGAKEPIDLGINGNFGYRLGVNWGFALLEHAGVGVQIGTSVNYSQNALRILPFVDGTVDHWQNFTTVGIFQRTDSGLHWGAVYDFRFDDYYDQMRTGQWRAQIGSELNPDNEIGFWAAFRDHGDSATIGPLAFSVQPISQWNVYWRHIWTGEIVTRAWVGLASEHSRFSLFIPRQPSINHPVTFGADFHVPLTETLALFGEAHFITPNDTGTLSATLGVAWYPGTARGAARNRFAPLLPVANNTNFALDVR